ncbi:MAG: FHA domain-containing protein [Leptolyngbyaceae cyanobacterium]
MIVCPNCNHQNPDGAVQCEACYTPLPTLTHCPSCKAAVQSDASFCGQCGFDLRQSNAPGTPEPDMSTTETGQASEPVIDYELTSPGNGVEIPELLPPEPLVESEPVVNIPDKTNPGATSETPAYSAGISAPIEASEPMTSPPEAPPPPLPATSVPPGSTQLQINQAKLLHVQTNTVVELPSQLSILHIGKPNDRIPPTIDVSGFPSSEIVSRVHASIRVEGDIYYLEDVGSSNGTYINNMPLPPGNRHRLRGGDRIALGKGDKVTFIFQSG